MVQLLNSVSITESPTPKSTAGKLRRSDVRSCLPVMKFDAATRWGRNVLAAIVAMALLTMLAIGVTILRTVANNRSGASPATVPLTIRVTVNPGESLWSLSQRYGNPNIGIQDRVDALAQANGVGAGTSLVAGQRLLVPVSNPMELARLQTHLASAH